MLDVLRIEEIDERWGEMMTPVVDLIEDLLLVGDFDAASQLVEVLTREAAAGESTVRRQYAVTAIDMLVAGPMMRNIVTHLGAMEETQFERVKAMCLSLGEVVVKPLAEALSIEERARPRQRLTAILIAFGAVGKRTAERLKSSPNPAVRRTAIYLLREFGGSEALPDLTELLDDNEPQVQREAVRAILSIGTEQSYQVLRGRSPAAPNGPAKPSCRPSSACATSARRRCSPTSSATSTIAVRSGKCICARSSRSARSAIRKRSRLSRRRSIAASGGPRAATPLLRSAAAEALARIGTAEAQAVLSEAASSGPRGVRTAVRPHLNSARSRARERGPRS